MISLKPDHLKRYRDLVRVFTRYGLLDMVRTAGNHDDLEHDPVMAIDEPSRGHAADLATDLETMGPAYIKLGQLMSTRPDLFPAAYLESLTRLQDKVKPFPYEQVEAIVHTELGIRISKAFSYFDPKPLASASLGQVHRAALRDGREVAVKIQRPGIRKEIWEEFEILGGLADMFDRHTSMGRKFKLGRMLDEFRKTLAQELDYRLEASNLRLMRENLKAFDRLLVPAAIDDYTTSRVLTMEYVSGIKITKLSPVCRTEYHGPELAGQLFHAYLQQLVVDGFLHADPHPGNVFITEDNRLALLDLGMVVRLSPGLQNHVLQLLVALSEGRGEDVADYAVQIGTPSDTFNKAAFRRETIEIVKQCQSMRGENLQVGRVVLDVTRVARDHGLDLPAETTMVGQTLLKLDQVGRVLDPAFDPAKAVREHATELGAKRLLKGVQQGSVLTAAMDMREFLGKLPSRVNRIMDLVAGNELKIRTDVLDEALLMEGIQKVANRITTGLVIAALIVGAALVMRIESSVRIFGYPALGVLLFLAAAVAGIVLVTRILVNDVKSKHSPRTSPSKDEG